jgi:hypothetical protein
MGYGIWFLWERASSTWRPSSRPSESERNTIMVIEMDLDDGGEEIESQERSLEYVRSLFHEMHGYEAVSYWSACPATGCATSFSTAG